VQKAEGYERKIKRIVEVQKERKKWFEEAEIEKMRLEKEKERIIAVREFPGKGPREWQELADTMGIDLDEIRRRAKESRRWRRGKLPPIEEKMDEKE
jgi:hypothetical protein